jgi:TonB family protein
MKPCTYTYAAVCSLAFGAAFVAACGGSQTEAATPEAPKAEPASPATPASSVAIAAEATPAAPSSSAAAAAPDRDISDIQAVVGSNRDMFRNCYERSLKAHPGIKGKYVLTFVINPDGSVKSAETDQSTSQIHQSDMASCAETAVRTLKFPPSKKGKESRASYPFDFNPKPPSASASRP